MNEELLRELYWDERLSLIKIAQKFGVSGSTILYWMKKLKIPRRSISEAMGGPKLSERLLRELYWDKELSKNQISRELGVSASLVYRRMIKFKIPRRSVSEAHKGRPLSKEHRRSISEAQKGEKHHFYGKHHTKETRKKISDALKGEKNHFYGKRHSEETRRKISERQKGEKHFLYGKKMSLEARRNNSEAHKGIKNPMYGRTGEQSPVWRGGISFEPYSPEFNDRLKKTIRERDNYTCKICGCRGICVHHIDYDKKNSDSQNLVTLCIKCHGETHHNREKWISYFRNGG